MRALGTQGAAHRLLAVDLDGTDENEFFEICPLRRAHHGFDQFDIAFDDAPALAG